MFVRLLRKEKKNGSISYFFLIFDGKSLKFIVKGVVVEMRYESVSMLRVGGERENLKMAVVTIWEKRKEKKLREESFFLK